MKQRCSPTKFEFFVIASLTTWTLEPLTLLIHRLIHFEGGVHIPLMEWRGN